MKRILSLLSIPILALAACSPKVYAPQSHTEQFYSITGKSAATDTSAIAHMLQPYKRGVDTQMTVVIGHTDEPLTKAQPESLLGNFMADAQLEAGRRINPKTIAAIANYGGIRIPYIAPGAITKGKIYELMPFDNMLTLIDMPGDALHKLCDAMAAKKGWPVSGITFIIKDNKATDIMIGGQPLSDALFYTIATNDYIARGGDNCDMLTPLKKRFTTIFLRDVFINYIADLERAGKPLHPSLDKRISYAE